MQISDIIEIISIITTLFTSIVAIVISVKTLKQNEQMLEETTPPYIVIYNDLVNGAGMPIQFMIIKNFGQTAATITHLEITPKVTVQYSNGLFEHMDGQIIAPGQSYTTAFKLNDCSTVLTADISYSSGNKNYHETFKISQEAISDHVHSKVKVEGAIHAQEIIAGCFQDYLRSQL